MPPPTNILFIMADQFRHDYLGCAGADWVKTPQIDRLAAMGTRFTQCTTNSPVCVPARIGLATGLQPRRVGCLDNHCFLPLSATTYYQRLRDHGYIVGCVGKLDLAKPDPYNGLKGDRPRAFSFGFTHPEEVEGKMHCGNHRQPIGPYTFYLQQHGLLETLYQERVRQKSDNANFAQDTALPAEHFQDAYIGRRAAEWLANVSGEFPWHYFVSFAGPHDPFDPPTSYADRYRAAAMPPALKDDLAHKPQRIRKRLRNFTDEQVAVARRQYCAAITLIDDYVGRILDTLQERGQLESTCIIFASDHGEMAGDFGLMTKHTAYEASMRVPLIVAGPGIARGAVSAALVELSDVNPTICEIAGLPPQARIDGRSFARVLANPAAGHRDETVTEEEGFFAVRTGRWKYIATLNDLTELYNLEEDPTELRNVAAEHPEVVRDLGRRFRERLMLGESLR